MVRVGWSRWVGTAGDETIEQQRGTAPGGVRTGANYLCYLRYDSVVFYSGYTSDADTLNDQVTDVLKTITAARAISGGLTQEFTKTGRLSVFLHRSQSLSVVKDLLAKETWIDLANVEFRSVDGFAGEKYLIEIEATALAG